MHTSFNTLPPIHLKIQQNASKCGTAKVKAGTYVIPKTSPSLPMADDIAMLRSLAPTIETLVSKYRYL